MVAGKKARSIWVVGERRGAVEWEACFVKPGVKTSPKRWVAVPPKLGNMSARYSRRRPVEVVVLSRQLGQTVEELRTC